MTTLGNLVYEYIGDRINSYMGEGFNLLEQKSSPYEKFNEFMAKYTQDVYNTSCCLVVNILGEEKLKESSILENTQNNFKEYIEVNYQDYNFDNPDYTINIIAFDKKLVYYLMYIRSILATYSDEKVIFNICIDSQTYDAHVKEFNEYNINSEYSKHLYSHQTLNYDENDNTTIFDGPLITLVDKYFDLSKNNTSPDNFISGLINFLKQPNIIINYIVIKDSFGKGIGMKRGIINYHNFKVGSIIIKKILDNVDPNLKSGSPNFKFIKKYKLDKSNQFVNGSFMTLVLDDNITHIIKLMLTTSDGSVDSPVYIDESSETDIECGAIEISSNTRLFTAIDKQINIPTEKSELNKSKYIGTRLINSKIQIDEESVGEVKNDSIFLSHKLSSTDSTNPPNDSNLEPDKQFRLLKIDLPKYVDNDEVTNSPSVYIDLVKKPKEKDDTTIKDLHRLKLCNWKTHGIMSQDNEDFKTNFSKCKYRISILEMYKKLYKKMKKKSNSKCLIGGIVKGQMGSKDSEITICPDNATSVYKLTLQRQVMLWNEKIIYNVFSARFWEDLPFNSLIVNKKFKIIKLNTFALRFGHFTLTDNEDYLSSKIKNIEDSKFLELILRNNISGINEPYIFTAFSRYIIKISKLKPNDFGFGTVSFNYTKNQEKYRFFHVNTQNFANWLENDTQAFTNDNYQVVAESIKKLTRVEIKTFLKNIPQSQSPDPVQLTKAIKEAKEALDAKVDSNLSKDDKKKAKEALDAALVEKILQIVKIKFNRKFSQKIIDEKINIVLFSSNPEKDAHWNFLNSNEVYFINPVNPNIFNGNYFPSCNYDFIENIGGAKDNLLTNMLEVGKPNEKVLASIKSKYLKYKNKYLEQKNNF